MNGRDFRVAEKTLALLTCGTLPAARAALAVRSLRALMKPWTNRLERNGSRLNFKLSHYQTVAPFLPTLGRDFLEFLA